MKIVKWLLRRFSLLEVLLDKTSKQSKIFKEVLDSLRYFILKKQPLKNSEFVFGRTIGTGTFGRVRLMNFVKKRPASNVYFALKIVHLDNLQSEKERQHIRREVQLLPHINHPFIVRAFGAVRTIEAVYIVMEFVVGGELFSRLHRCRFFSRACATFYAAEVVSALGYLHSRGVIYRDLKTENILIDSNGHLKLADFGFARRLKGKAYTLCGTAEYLAPEVVGDGGYRAEADWWSLGVLVFEMLTGETPYKGVTVRTLLWRTKRDKVEFPERVDGVARDFCERLLARNPKRRLGRKGVAEIKSHRFFDAINWRKLEKKKIKPPYKPRVRDGCDTRHFAEYSETEENKIFECFD